MAKLYDVWVLASNRIYKGVPFEVVSDWAQQGRLGPADKVRAAGSKDAWLGVNDEPSLADYLYSKRPLGPTVEAVDAPPGTDVRWAGRRAGDDDDDPDMIPLIDISLVLLIFFMMTSAVSQMAPVDVPRMKNQFEVSSPDGFLMVVIDRRGNGSASYSLRINDQTARPDDRDKDSLDAVMQRVEAELESRRSPPEVRFAAHREISSEKVHELMKKLEALKQAGKIIRYRAEVVEKK